MSAAPLRPAPAESRRPSIVRRLVWIGLAAAVAFVLSVVFILLPAVKHARESGTRYYCRGRMRTLYLATINYAEQNGGQLPDLVTRNPGLAPQSWRVTVLPFLGRENALSTWSPAQAWDKPANRATAQTKISELFCPDNPFPTDDLGRFYTAYAAMSGPGTAFPAASPLSLDAISHADGSAHTILFGECTGLQIVWTEPRDIDTSKHEIGITSTRHSPAASSILSSPHRGGAYVVMADGSTKFLSDTIDRSVLKALTTATGGEAIPRELQP